jgi:hypothetical protein
MKETPTQTTEDQEAELRRLEERTRIALARAVCRAAEYAATLSGKTKKRQRVRHGRQVRSTK